MPISRLVMEFVLTDLASGAVKKMTENLRHMGQEGQQAAKAFEDMAERMARGVKAAGISREMAAAVLMPGMKAAGSMDASLRRLQANMDAGLQASAQKMMGQARRVAGDIAGPTPFSPQQVIDEAITEQLKAGMSVKDVLGGGAKASAYLATAEGTDIGTANSAILAVTTKFNLAGDEIVNAADLLTRASGASEASAASLQEGLANIVSSRSLGLSPEDTLAALAMMDKSGRKGSAGGTALEAFFSSLATADKKAKLGVFKDGEFGGMENMLTQLRAKFGSMSAQKRSILGEKLFGREGRPALEAFLRTDAGGLESMRAGMAGAMGLNEKMGIIGGGTDTSWEAVRGTAEDAMATAFEPLLGPSKKLADGLNDAAGATGKWLRDSPLASKTASHLAVGAVALPAIYSVVSFLSAAGSGFKGLRLSKGLGSMAGLGAGVATGKALEQAAGVQPVFVVNMPAGGIGGPGGVAGEAAAAGARSAASAGGLLGAFKGPVTMNAGTVTLAAGMLAAGWEAGTAINEKLIKGTRAEDYVQAALGTQALMNPFVTVPLRAAEALGSNRAGEVLQSARYAQDQVEWLRALKGAIGMKISVHVDGQNSPTVVTDGVDDVEVSASRGGVP